MKRPILIGLVSAGLLALGSGRSPANPQGGQVVSGSASINSTPGTVTINQTSSTAIINWNSFSINSGELTKFIQPSETSAALNRVLGGQTSYINGTLSANGQIYLINGNGIIIGPGGIVNAQSFTASTRDISDDDFLSGNLHFSGSNSAGVQNLGTINALGGDVYLIGKTVDNQGSINASNGTVGLASADDVLLTLVGDEHVFVNPSTTASAAPTQTAVHNSGSIVAAQAELKAANGNLFALAINNQGTIRATSVQHRGGRIFLTADSGTVANSGVITAKDGANGGQVKITGGSVWNTSTVDVSGANGGSVTVSAQNFDNDGSILANGTNAGGSVDVTFSGNALAATSGLIDASGGTSGGSIQFEGTGTDSMAYLSLKLDVSSATGAGGEIQLNSLTLYLTGANLVANGATQGGRIFVGKDDPTAASPSSAVAQTVYVSNGTTLSANATSTGNGGQVSIYSSGSTQFLGSVEAIGGVNGGNGGLIEVSGAAATYFGGQANASAPGGGTAGTFLLDPQYITVAPGSSGSSFEFVDPDPGANNQFGSDILSLTSNTTLVTSPGDSFSGAGSGAVYLFNDTNGALISSLRGSYAGDGVGNDVMTLSGGNALVVTQNWNSGAGAVTFFNGTTGLNGAVDSSNSLVGSVSTDQVGSGGITILSNGNYVVVSPYWGNNLGAVTLVDGSNGTIFGSASVGAPVSSSNSVVGSTSGDEVGSYGVTDLQNGAYAIVSPQWNGQLGAVTWVDASTGVAQGGGSTVGGAVSASNSLIGTTAGDEVGSNGVWNVGNNLFLVASPDWTNGSNSYAGAITFVSFSGSSAYFAYDSTYSTPALGTLSSANSLVGFAAYDTVGAGSFTSSSSYSTTSFSSFASVVGGAQLLTTDNGNLVVNSPEWGGVGALTYVNVTTGANETGVVTAANSLIGTSDASLTSVNVLQNLYNGNYAIVSPYWNGGAGAVTWYDGVNGTTVGTVGSAFSLVGSSSSDSVGNGGIYVFSNGDYLVDSYNWSNNTGAITEINGSTGVPYGATLAQNAVSTSNSLTGASPGDYIGSGGFITYSYSPITSSYNYLPSSSCLIYSPSFNNSAGAVTYANGTSLNGQVIGSTNSLVGAAAGDNVGSGGITVLSNGNYVVDSPSWSGGMGAVTLDGAGGAVVSSSNSVVGSSTSDSVGSGGVTDLGNGVYAILSPQWNGQVGAVTWVNATTGIAQGGSSVGGAVSASNSLVGSTAGDTVGSNGIWNAGSNLFLVASPNWANGSNSNAGAMTFVNFSGNTAYFAYNSTTPAVGAVSSANSLVGANSGDQAGTGTFYFEGDQILSTDNGNLIVGDPGWNGGLGAITYVNVSTGANEIGTIGPSISLVGSPGATFNNVGRLTSLGNGNFVIDSYQWNNNTGAVTWYDGINGTTIGTVGNSNSLTGSASGDNVGIGSGGYGAVTVLANGNYLVDSYQWNNDTGAVTLVNGANGIPYGDSSVGTVVKAANSLIGANTGDSIGSGSGSAPGITILGNGNYLIESEFYGSDKGAVTWGDGSATTLAASLNGQVVSSANSLVGSTSGDEIGSNGITQLYEAGNYNYLVVSPLWNGDVGAVTFGNGSTGVKGVVSATNSLVGSTAGDEIGSYGITELYENGYYNYLVLSPLWSNNMGAVTFGNGQTGVTGVVSSTNSLVGTTAGDKVGGGYIEEFYDSSINGYNYLVMSPQWNSSAGAATWGSGTTGISGVVGAANSIIGGSSNAGLSFSGFTSNYTQFYVSFSSDTSGGGDGRVFISSVDAPTSSSSTSIDPNTLTYSFNPGSSVTIDASSITAILNTGTDVTMQANSDITINQAIITSAGGSGGNLTLDAGRSILINANITTDNGNLTLLANDPNALSAYRDPGFGNIAQSGSTIDVGKGTFQATVGGVTNAGDIALDNIDATTVTVSALSSGNITLGGIIQATNTTIDAGNMFINLAGPNAITGQWNIYSASPYSDAFGGLASNNYAVFNATPSTSVGPGNNYLFAYSPTLDVVALSREKAVGATIDYTSPQLGVDYTVLGFVPAASFGNVFLQDTAANTLSGVPAISSLGAPASASPGVYPIQLTQNTVALTRSGFSLAFPSSVGGVSPTITVGNFFGDSLSDPISQQVTAFAVTGLNNLPVVSQFYVYDPSIETFVPVMVGAISGGAINDGNGNNVALGSSTAYAPGPSRLVVPGNGIWNIFGGLVHSVPPPPFVLEQFKLNLNPTVYANMHHYVFGN